MRFFPLPTRGIRSVGRADNIADWPEDQTEAAAQQQNGGESSKHLWEESWDDDDTSDDFSQQLKYDIPDPTPVVCRVR